MLTVNVSLSIFNCMFTWDILGTTHNNSIFQKKKKPPAIVCYKAY